MKEKDVNRGIYYFCYGPKKPLVVLRTRMKRNEKTRAVSYVYFYLVL